MKSRCHLLKIDEQLYISMSIDIIEEYSNRQQVVIFLVFTSHILFGFQQVYQFLLDNKIISNLFFRNFKGINTPAQRDGSLIKG